MTEKVKEYILKHDELTKKKQKILELQQDSKVKEYIDLVNEVDLESKRAREIITVNHDNVNKILFKYGYYNISKCGKYPSVTLIYRDLETGFYYRRRSFDEYQIMYDFCFENEADKKEFENRHFGYEQAKEYFFGEFAPEQQGNVIGKMYVITNN